MSKIKKKKEKPDNKPNSNSEGIDYGKHKRGKLTQEQFQKMVEMGREGKLFTEVRQYLGISHYTAALWSNKESPFYYKEFAEFRLKYYDESILYEDKILREIINDPKKAPCFNAWGFRMRRFSKCDFYEFKDEKQQIELETKTPINNDQLTQLITILQEKKQQDESNEE